MENRQRQVVHCRWGKECRSYKKGKCTKYAHNFIDPFYFQNIYVLLHGTSEENAYKIQNEGFNQSGEDCMLGRGVYFTRHFEKAKKYGEKIIVAIVKVGKTKLINKNGHPSQKSWNQEGYDTAFVPEKTEFSQHGYSEICVYDPANIEVINILDHTDFQ